MAVPSRYKSVANCLFCRISLLVGDCRMMLTRRRRNRSLYDIVITCDIHTPSSYCRGCGICPARQLVNHNEVWLDQNISQYFAQRHSIGGLTVTFLLLCLVNLGVWELMCFGCVLAGMKVGCGGGCLLPEFERLSLCLSLVLG